MILTATPGNVSEVAIGPSFREGQRSADRISGRPSARLRGWRFRGVRVLEARGRPEFLRVYLFAFAPFRAAVAFTFSPCDFSHCRTARRTCSLSEMPSRSLIAF